MRTPVHTPIYPPRKLLFHEVIVVKAVAGSSFHARVSGIEIGRCEDVDKCNNRAEQAEAEKGPLHAALLISTLWPSQDAVNLNLCRKPEVYDAIRDFITGRF